MKENITTEIGKAQSDTTSLIFPFRYGLWGKELVHISTWCNSDVIHPAGSITTIFTEASLLAWKIIHVKCWKFSAEGKEGWHHWSQMWKCTMSESHLPAYCITLLYLKGAKHCTRFVTLCLTLGMWTFPLCQIHQVSWKLQYVHLHAATTGSGGN